VQICGTGAMLPMYIFSRNHKSHAYTCRKWKKKWKDG